jgi:hypothetical protein
MELRDCRAMIMFHGRYDSGRPAFHLPWHCLAVAFHAGIQTIIQATIETVFETVRLLVGPPTELG